MDQIHRNKIKMRPRMYFIFGSLLAFIGLVSSVVASVFFVGLIRFSLRAHGPMAGYKLDQLLSAFPWWAPVFAVVGLVAGIWLLRRYEFSFKLNFKFLIVGFVLAVILGGWVVDSIGLNDILVRKGPMHGVMRQYMQDENIQGRPGWGRNR